MELQIFSPAEPAPPLVGEGVLGAYSFILRPSPSLSPGSDPGPSLPLGAVWHIPPPEAVLAMHGRDGAGVDILCGLEGHVLPGLGIEIIVHRGIKIRKAAGTRAFPAMRAHHTVKG